VRPREDPALDDRDPVAEGGQARRQRRAGGAGPDDADVARVAHGQPVK
jgi:hypothetical protein